MKNVTLKSAHQGLVRIGVAAAAWMLCLGAVQTKASGNPSGGSSQTWDCILSGNGERGIAYIRFSSDFSVTGVELLAPTPASLAAAASSVGRGGTSVGRGGTSVGRGGTTTSGGSTNSTSSTSTTNVILFGFGPFTGNWTFDAKSNIVGSYVRQGTIDTNEADVTFTGAVSSNKTPRLTLHIAFGTTHSTYQGVIAQTVASTNANSKFPDPTTGPWSGSKQAGGQTLLEQFTVTSTVIPGVYDLSGTGPDYTTSGQCLVSSQGRIGFSVVETNFPSSTNSNLRATMGAFSDTATALKARTTGIQEDKSGVTFNATLVK